MKPYIEKFGEYWFLAIPAANYRGGWGEWVTCLVGLKLYYQNKANIDAGNQNLNILINDFISDHTYDYYYQYSLRDWMMDYRNRK